MNQKGDINVSDIHNSYDLNTYMFLQGWEISGFAWKLSFYVAILDFGTLEINKDLFCFYRNPQSI